MSFAPLFAGLMIVFWPVMATLGTQGFSPLLGVVGIAAAFYARPRPDMAPVLIALVAFVAWISASTLWSPAGEGLRFSGSLAGEDFAVKASWLRIAGTALAGVLAVLAALAVIQGRPVRTTWILLAAFLVQAVIFCAIAVVPDFALSLFYDDPRERIGSGMLNVLRNANALALVMPILLALMWTGGVFVRLALAIALLAISLAYLRLGAQAALIAMALMVLAAGFANLAGRHAVRWLLGGQAVWVLVSPLILPHLAEWLIRAGIRLPFSFHSRAWSWSATGEKIAERPTAGHGLEASGLWQETYAAHPDWLAYIVARGGDERAWSNYPVIPGHPHNMALEIWAETGAIGAFLAAAVLLTLAWRLTAGRRLSAFFNTGLAGLIGAAFSIFNFAYSAWNEVFWATLVLVAVSLIVIDKARPAHA